MDRFIRKVNEKVNLPDDSHPDRYFKGQIFENPFNKKVSNLFENVVLQIQLSNACRCIYIYIYTLQIQYIAVRYYAKSSISRIVSGPQIYHEPKKKNKKKNNL